MDQKCVGFGHVFVVMEGFCSLLLGLCFGGKGSGLCEWLFACCIRKCFLQSDRCGNIQCIESHSKRGNESASQIAKMNTNQVPAGVGRDGPRREERGSTSKEGESKRARTDCVEQAQKGHGTRTCPWCPHLEAKGLTSRILDSEPSSVGKRILPATERVPFKS